MGTFFAVVGISYVFEYKISESRLGRMSPCGVKPWILLIEVSAIGTWGKMLNALNGAD